MTELVVSLKPPLPHRDGVGGLLKNHHCLTVTELVVSLKTTELAATAATGGVFELDPMYVNVQVHAAWKALEMKARSPGMFTDMSDATVLTKMVPCPAA